jgi:rhamnosyltransferase
MDNPTVSIVIPTLNAEKYLDSMLSSLIQAVESSHIFLIDSSSNDKTFNISKGYDIQFHTIQQCEFNHGKTRNLSLKFCNTDFVVFMTQDAQPVNSNFLNLLLEPFQMDPLVAATYSRQLPRKDAQFLEQLDRLIKYPNNDIIQSQETLSVLGSRAYYLSNSCAAYRMSFFRELGGFPEDEIMGEDAIFALKAISKGYKIIYTSRSEVYHSHNYTFVELFRRYFDTGVYRTKALDLFIFPRFKGDANQGSSYTLQIFSALIKKKRYDLIPKFMINIFFSLLGYSLGKRYKFIPTWLCRKLSMHFFYWDNISR